jgi:hypothetical protein
MMGLWADGWFYISSAGLLVSGILFFFLLGQYRVASEAADATEEEHVADKDASASPAIRPVYVPHEESPAQVASHPLPEPEPKREAAPKPEEVVERRRDPATTTGGISPAVVYLQNIKVELADLHKDLRSLAKRVDDELASVSTRDEALIDRLGELARAVESLKNAAPETPAPKKARKAEKAPETVEPSPESLAEVVLEAPAAAAPAPEPVPEPKTEPTRVTDETIRMDLSALVAPEPAARPEPAPEPEAPAAEAPAPEEKPRRGPVWPV